MFTYRIRSKKVYYDLYLPSHPTGQMIIYAPGLPGHPRKKELGEAFSAKGFAFFEMRYRGSWESEGVFTLDNCVKSLKEAYEFVNCGSASELRFGEKITWKTHAITILASSFGGAVALSTDIREAHTMLLLSPLIDISQFVPTLRPVGSADDLFYLLTKGYGMVYRGLTHADWKRFLAGNTLVNPLKNIDNLKNKKIVLIQGKQDFVITPEASSRSIEKLQKLGVKDIKYYVVAGAGHGTDLEKKAMVRILKFLGK